MILKELISKNIFHYARYYRMVAAAVVVTVAVIVGSMVIGDSVRSTLVKRVGERLGDTETVIFSQDSFLNKSLAESLNGRGILLFNGFIPDDGKLIPVVIWGVSDMAVGKGEVKINERLSRELGSTTNDDIVLRLPATGLVPSGSMFVKDNYTTSLRLKLTGRINVDSGGNMSLKNEQAIPLNVFVNQDELASALAIEGKINLILSPDNITSEDVEKVWKYEDSGIKTSSKKTQNSNSEPAEFVEITSDRIFIQNDALRTIIEYNDKPANRLFSYLAISIRTNLANPSHLSNKAKSIPYCFITAADSYKGKALNADEIILSHYSAQRLGIGIGDSVSISYFVSHDLKTMETDSVKLCVGQIVPLHELIADSTLSADFPGLSHVAHCTDWDSDLPIDMSLITKTDEQYWELYRTTPKAIIPYCAIEKAWNNSYGSATAIRINSQSVDMSGLKPSMFGIQVLHPREGGVTAARSGVDFSGLFLALGFFIIISAMLLMLVPISEMLYQRRHEIELLKSLGYTRKRIINILWHESAPIALVSSVVGVFVGLLYTYLTLLMLGSVWKGATHTEGFSIFPNIWTISGSMIAGILISLALLRWAISRSLKVRKKSRKPKLANPKLWLCVFATLILLGTIIINLTLIKSTVLFVLTGVIFISVAAAIGDYVLYRQGSRVNSSFGVSKLIWATIYSNRRQAILAFITLSSGVFIVFSVGLNRKGFADSSEIITGTGGYTLWCESNVPIYHNISTAEGRSKLALSDLPTDVRTMQIFRYRADDASCLNLNKVSRPTVLGVDMEQFRQSRFDFSNSEQRHRMIESMRSRTDSTYPVFVDETVLTWGLIMNIGDTLIYEGSMGQKAYLRIAGTLKNSIFQGNILIDKRFFAEIWDQIKGSEVMLVEVSENKTDFTKNLISQALSEYGVRVTKTSERLREFYSVTDTYLTIFLTLGSLGLLLGIISFVIVIGKNLAARTAEMAIYRSLGFSNHKIVNLMYRENIIIPLYAILTGIVGSLVGIAAGFTNVSLGVWVLTLTMALIFTAFILIFVKRSVQNKLRNCLNFLP